MVHMKRMNKFFFSKKTSQDPPTAPSPKYPDGEQDNHQPQQQLETLTDSTGFEPVTYAIPINNMPLANGSYLTVSIFNFISVTKITDITLTIQLVIFPSP